MRSIWNKNNWNNVSKRLFGSYSHSGIPGFPFRLFFSQEQNSRNIFRNIFRNKFLFRNIPNERALRLFECTETVSCRLSLWMAWMEMDWNLKKKLPIFSSAMLCYVFQKSSRNLLWIAISDKIHLISLS